MRALAQASTSPMGASPLHQNSLTTPSQPKGNTLLFPRAGCWLVRDDPASCLLRWGQGASSSESLHFLAQAVQLREGRGGSL